MAELATSPCEQCPVRLPHGRAAQISGEAQQLAADWPLKDDPHAVLGPGWPGSLATSERTDDVRKAEEGADPGRGATAFPVKRPVDAAWHLQVRGATAPTARRARGTSTQVRLEANAPRQRDLRSGTASFAGATRSSIIVRSSLQLGWRLRPVGCKLETALASRSQQCHLVHRLQTHVGRDAICSGAA